MLRSIVSSIEFEKFRRNWSEKNSAQRFLRKRLKLNTTLSYGSRCGSRAILTMKFASDSPQFSYVELTLNNVR
ncbi:hypothetical protein [Leptospira noguchii]|uniref:hypothetical protein n=1 Tax=Leptospira noguchii TaxID=28182 RepID=UPI0012BC72C8|nr:hypothetical protein [Leptospira noguchii]